MEFEKDFRALGIDIHDPIYGTWWEARSHNANAARLNADWRAFLGTEPTYEQTLEFGRQTCRKYGQTPRF